MSNDWGRKTVEDAMLSVKISNIQPVDLIDYAQSMISLGAEYSEFIASCDNHLGSDDIKLFVKEVRSGSIITELVAIAPALIPFAEHGNSVLEFAEHLKKIFSYLRGSSDVERPENLDKQTLSRIDKLVEPIAKDSGSTIKIDASGNTGTLNITINSLEANAMQNMISKEIEDMKEPVTGKHSQVVLYWAQARNTSGGRSGDKARIESIYKGDVKVVFSDEYLKHIMLHEQPHPFDSAYIVDVYVETVQDKPVLYRVVALHDVMSI